MLLSKLPRDTTLANTSINSHTHDTDPSPAKVSFNNSNNGIEDVHLEHKMTVSKSFSSIDSIKISSVAEAQATSPSPVIKPCYIDLSQPQADNDSSDSDLIWAQPKPVAQACPDAGNLVQHKVWSPAVESTTPNNNKIIMNSDEQGRVICRRVTSDSLCSLTDEDVWPCKTPSPSNRTMNTQSSSNDVSPETARHDPSKPLIRLPEAKPNSHFNDQKPESQLSWSTFGFNSQAFQELSPQFNRSPILSNHKLATPNKDQSMDLEEMVKQSWSGDDDCGAPIFKKIGKTSKEPPSLKPKNRLQEVLQQPMKRPQYVTAINVDLSHETVYVDCSSTIDGSFQTAPDLSGSQVCSSIRRANH